MFKKLLFCTAIFACSHTLLAGTPDKKNPPKDIIIDIPADLDRNYDEMLNLWAASGSTLECEFGKETAVLFDDSTYIKKLYALPTTMEMAFNGIVKRYIEMYADRRRGQVSYMLGQGAYYFPLFEEALAREGLPLELKYLPVIESALNPIAKSRVGATGLWQFMPATGKMYKLEINSLVDERRDPYKSTQAAVKYLKDMFRIYGDWNLVIAAYNCGPGNVNKAIRRSGDKRDYWDIYEYLPKETRGYVPAFIAATYIMSYYSDHKICPAETDLPMLVDTLGINKMVHFEQIADIIQVPIEEIRRLNPQFQGDIIPGAHKEYALKLPIQNLTAFIANEDTIYAHKKDELFTHKQVRNIAAAGNTPSSGGYATHKVKKGENLGAIAMRHRVSVAQIRSWNGIKSDKLDIGQTLKVSDYVAPVKATKTQAQVSVPKVQKEATAELIAEDGVLKRATTVTKTTTSNYTVTKGDTWNTVANKTGTSEADIRKWNKIKGKSLPAGKNLKIQKTEVVEELAEVTKPEGFLGINIGEIFDAYVGSIEFQEPSLTLGLGLSRSAETASNDDLSEANVVYHKVIYGETLSQIASKYNVSVKDILSWNNITEKSSSQITRLLIILPDETNEEQRMAKHLHEAGGKAA